MYGSLLIFLSYVKVEKNQRSEIRIRISFADSQNPYRPLGLIRVLRV